MAQVNITVPDDLLIDFTQTIRKRKLSMDEAIEKMLRQAVAQDELGHHGVLVDPETGERI